MPAMLITGLLLNAVLLISSVQANPTVPADTYVIQTEIFPTTGQQRIRVIDPRYGQSIKPQTVLNISTQSGLAFDHFLILGTSGNITSVFAHSTLGSLHIANIAGSSSPQFAIPPSFQNNGLDMTAMTPYSDTEVLVATKSGQMYIVNEQGQNTLFAKGALWSSTGGYGMIRALQLIDDGGREKRFAAVTEKGWLVVATRDPQQGTPDVQFKVDLTQVKLQHVHPAALFQGMSTSFVAGKNSAWVYAHYDLKGMAMGYAWHVDYATGKVDREYLTNGATQLLDANFSTGELTMRHFSTYFTLDKSGNRTNQITGAFDPLGMLNPVALGTAIQHVSHPNSNRWIGVARNQQPAVKKIVTDPETADEFKEVMERKLYFKSPQVTKILFASAISKSDFQYDLYDMPTYLGTQAATDELKNLGFKFRSAYEIVPLPGKENDVMKLDELMTKFARFFADTKKAKTAATCNAALTKP